MRSDSRARDPMAEYADFFEQHHRRALRLAYVMCGDNGNAEDIVAESFARMYPAWQKGQIEDPVAYLRRTIANLVRGTWRHKEVERRYDARVKVMWAAETPGVDDALVARDAVSLALTSLPPKQRAVVALRYLEDLSEAETASVLDISVGTVKAHASRGLDRLREVMAGMSDATGPTPTAPDPN
jgi:RNA polymerase sigma-70 factor (sigma-E family)